MTRKQPSQERSRDRVERILLAAQSLILESGSLDALTTSAVSEESGMSLATVYRYFEDRFEIILELLEREMDELDELTMSAVAALDTVTIESLTRAILVTRFEYFDEHSFTSTLWFGAREKTAVRDRIDRHYRDTIEWLSRGCVESGMLLPTVPDWAGESASWLADQAFETMFTKERPERERKSIMNGFIELLADQLAKFTTDLGRRGISPTEFIAAAGEVHATDMEDDR